METKTIVREASELGITPGQFPAVITISGRHYRQYDVERHDGDVVAVLYRAAEGYALTVLND